MIEVSVMANHHHQRNATNTLIQRKIRATNSPIIRLGERAAPDFLVNDVGHFSPACIGLLSREGVGHRRLLPGDEILEAVVDARIEGRCLIGLEPAPRDLVGTLGRGLLALGQPLLV